MAMKYIKCPHCKNDNGPKAVNENIKKMPLCRVSCSKCYKNFSWTAKYGKVEVYK